MRAPLEPAAGSAAALRAVRERIEGPGADRWLAPELAEAEDLVAEGGLLRAVESTVGALA